MQRIIIRMIEENIKSKFLMRCIFQQQLLSRSVLNTDFSSKHYVFGENE